MRLTPEELEQAALKALTTRDLNDYNVLRGLGLAALAYAKAVRGLCEAVREQNNGKKEAAAASMAPAGDGEEGLRLPDGRLE